MAEKPREPLKVYQCNLIITKDGVHWQAEMDVIEHAGKFWLVPDWLDNHSEKVTMPARIVSLETMVHHRTAGVRPRFLVENPVPSYVFDGRIPPEEASRYVVVEYPDIAFRRDASAH